VIYLLIAVIDVLFNMSQFLQGEPVTDAVGTFIYNWFGISSNYGILFTRPWTMITSLFLHLNFFHVFFNMIMLWFSGRIFLYYFPAGKMYTVYLWGGVVGNILFALSYHIFPVFIPMMNSAIAIGASGGVLAILIAVATKSPNYRLRFFITGNFALKWLAILFVVIDIVSIPYENSGGHLAHLGGALFGFLYVCIPKWKYMLTMPKIKKPKLHRTSRPKTDEEYNAEQTAYRKKVDAILDKISKSGYQSLTKEEKAFLFQTSNKRNW
jgi:membrane associated rhomboid family serine protease